MPGITRPATSRRRPSGSASLAAPEIEAPEIEAPEVEVPEVEVPEVEVPAREASACESVTDGCVAASEEGSAARGGLGAGAAGDAGGAAVRSGRGKYACETASFVPCVEEDCAPDGVDPAELPAYTVVAPVANAGEELAPRLTDLAPVGFPGDDAWAAQDFCGGLGAGLFGCSAPVRDKLLVDPF